MAQRGVASQAEVLRILSGIARDEEQTTQSRLKASELLGKVYGLFSDRGEDESDKPFLVEIRVVDGETPPGGKAAEGEKQPGAGEGGQAGAKTAGGRKGRPKKGE